MHSKKRKKKWRKKRFFIPLKSVGKRNVRKTLFIKALLQGRLSKRQKRETEKVGEY